MDIRGLVPEAWGPSPSPVSRDFAFVRGGNLWIADRETLACRQVTPFIDSPGLDKWQHVVHIVGWSKDGSALFFNFPFGDYAYGPDEEGHGMTVYSPTFEDCKSVERMQLLPQLREDATGTYSIVVGSSQTQKVSGPLNFIGRKPIGFAAPIDLPEGINLSQAFVSRDLTRMVVAQTFDNPLGSEIRSRNLPNGEYKPLTPRGGFDEYQWPQISPDGKSLSYLSQTSKLIVDGREVYSAWRIHRHWWINESVIVVIGVIEPQKKQEIVILDGSNGKVLGRHDD